MKPKYKYTHAPRNFNPTLSRFLVILVIILFLSLYPSPIFPPRIYSIRVNAAKNCANIHECVDPG